MADTHLNIIISAKDQASGIFKGLSGAMSGFIGGLTGGLVTKGIDLLGDAVRGVTSNIGGAIEEASNLSETVSKVGVVFGESKDKILEFGMDAASSLGMSRDAALAAAGTYGNLFRSMGMGEEASADMSTSLVSLAADLASFNNLSPEEVLEKLRAGLTGESEPLKALGVNINETLIKERALAMGFKVGKEPLDALTKATAAYSLIMEQTSLAQGDFARTSEGLANQQRIFDATITNLKATLGNALMPVLNNVIGIFNDWFNSEDGQIFIENLVMSLEVLAEWIGTNLPVAIQIMSAFWTNTLQPAIQTVWGFVQTSVIPIIQQLWDWLAVNLPPAIQALSDFWNNTLLPAIQAVWEFLTVDMLPVWEALEELLGVAIPLILTALAGLWENILKPALVAIWEFIQTYIIPIFEDWSEGIGGITGAIQSVVDWIGKMTDKLKNIKLPKWLTPGSPTPFEEGLWGINQALETLSAKQMPQLSVSMAAAGSARVANSAMASSRISQPSTQPNLDYHKFARVLRDELLKVM